MFFKLKGAKSTVIMSEGINDLLNQLQMVQQMIDISASKLNSLRVEGATDTNLIQQEIRTVEVWDGLCIIRDEVEQRDDTLTYLREMIPHQTALWLYHDRVLDKSWQNWSFLLSFLCVFLCSKACGVVFSFLSWQTTDIFQGIRDPGLVTKQYCLCIYQFLHS